jgi:DNA-binding SARP family transcriptional activator
MIGTNASPAGGKKTITIGRPAFAKIGEEVTALIFIECPNEGIRQSLMKTYCQSENASATKRACSRLWRASAPTAGLALASRPA